MRSITYIGNWKVNHTSQSLSYKNDTICLDHKQYLLLMLLIKHANKGLSKQTIFDEIWKGKVVTEDTIYVAINSLRRLLKDDAKNPQYIKTIPSLGYIFIAPVKYKTQFSKNITVLSSSLVFICFAFFAYHIIIKQFDSPPIISLTQEHQEQFIKAQFLLSQNQEQINTAADLLNDIYEQNSNHQPILTQLAFAHFKQLQSSQYDNNKVSIIMALLDKALAISPDDKLTHLLKARMYFLYVKNIKMADAHFNSALPLVEAHHHYGQFLLALGQFEKSLTHIKMYQSLNPKSYSNLSVSWVYAMSGQFTKAFAEINKVKEFQNESLYFHVGLQAIYEQTGKEKEAFLQLKKVMHLAGYNHKELDIVSAIFEQTQLKGVYSWLLKKDTKRLNIGQYTPPLALARYAIGAGEYDVAMEYLTQSFTQKQFEIMWVAVDPKYTPLSSNTEFQKLMKKIGVI